MEYLQLSKVYVNNIHNKAGTQAISIDASGDLTFTGSNTVTPTDSGWIQATLNSTWTHYGDPYGPVKYRKIGNIVNMQGITNENDTGVVFTLPAGYRPEVQIIIAAQMQNALGRLDIQKDGSVEIISRPSSGWCSFYSTFMVAD